NQAGSRFLWPVAKKPSPSCRGSSGLPCRRAGSGFARTAMLRSTPGFVRMVFEELLSGVGGGGRLEMRKGFIIGIGAGNPDYVTVQAINALNEIDVFFVMDKGREKQDLVRPRKEICERYIKRKSYRMIEVDDPERDRTASSYEAGVKAWHEQRAAV